MRINRLLIAGIVSVGLLTSCASDEEANGGTGSPATINLSLIPTTRAGGASGSAIPTGDGSANDEATLSHVYVGIFDNATYRITSDVPDYDYAASKKITTTTRANQILVAANIPKDAATVTAYNTTATTVALFKSVVQDLSYTTSDNGQVNTAKNTANSQSAKGLPMFGNAGLDLTNSSTVSVELKRAVARVALTKLDTAFASTSYTGAKFIPKEVFMYNVNDQYTWGTGLGSASVTTVTGGSTTGDATNLAESLNNYSYLSSGLTASYTFGTAAKPYFFYVFPHSSTSPTKLVVKGIFTPLSGSPEVTYYPIIINKYLDSSTMFSGDGIDGTSGKPTNDSQVSQNTCYSINLTIKGKGVSDPSIDIGPATVTVNTTVKKWDSSTEDITVQ